MTREATKSKASIRIQLFDAKGANKVIDQIYSDHSVELNEMVKAKDEEIERLKQELAWKLLCTDMAYGLHQYDTWEDVPNTTKESYLKNVSKYTK